MRCSCYTASDFHALYIMDVTSNFQWIGITDDEWWQEEWSVDGDYGGGGGDDHAVTEWWHRKEFDMLHIKWVR